ncbi:MAG: hypothetical protein HOB32_06475 [Nitrospina sp.]|nr:hypothetical protein [Nitrospina sp.]MBT6601286.1 hypothetical protein [Nitrospina sp.]
MESKKNIQQLIIFILIIFIATAMAGRKQFVLNPYEISDPLPQVATITLFDSVSEQIHPIYSKNFYTPPAFKLVPASFLFNSWFHIFSAIAFLALTIGGVFTLIRMGGFDNYQSMTITFFSLFVGNLIIRELFNIPLLGPAPFISYGYYSIRTPVIPLSLLGLIFTIKRRFILGGLLIGLTTFFHIKFGLRFFGLIFFSLLLWKFWGSRRLEWPQKNIKWGNITAFAISWSAIFVITYMQIVSSIGFFEALDLPRSQTLLSPLALLIKNQPDDWLISTHFGENLPFMGFLFMTATIGAFCELIIRYSPSNKMKSFAIFWEIAALGALVSFGVGLFFESFFINWLPVSISYAITMTRFWDLIWVIIIGFWVTLIPAITLVGKNIMHKLKKSELSLEKYFFHLVMLIFICANTAIFLINKDGEVIKFYKSRDKETPFLKLGNYVQICAPVTSEYKKLYHQAINSLQMNDDKKFGEILLRMDLIFNEFKVHLNNPPLQNPDSRYLKALNHSKTGNFTEILKLSTSWKRGSSKNEDFYWWSCAHSEPGVHIRSIKIPTKNYVDATDWIKLNLPIDQAVIQPPYIPKFTLYSQRIGFWDMTIDQHMMYLLKGYHGAGLHRLRSIAGPQAMVFETGNGILGPESREYFLRLIKNDLIKIRKDYPGYNYFLTENDDLRGYPKIYSNSSFSLYNISGS